MMMMVMMMMKMIMMMMMMILNCKLQDLHISNLACIKDHLQKQAISVKYKSNK